MTEMQKAYFVGREDSTNGTTGTHLYMEILYKGEADELENALNKVIKRQPYMRAKLCDNMQFEIADELTYKVNVIVDDCNDEKVIEDFRKKLSHKVYSQNDFPLFTIEMLGKNGCYRVFLSIDMLIADGISLYEICREIKEYIKTPDLNCDSRIEDLLHVSDYYSKNRMTNRYFKARDYYMKKLDDIYPAPSLGYLSTHSDGTFSHIEDTISAEDFNNLCQKALDKDFSATDILFTAYATVLSMWSRESSMSINTTSFIRPKDEKYTTVVGDFTTSMLVQSKIDWDRSFFENTRNMKKSLLVAYKNNLFEVPELVRELSRKNPGITMPVVFTSMLFDGLDLWDENFKCDYTVSQTSQVNLDCQIKKMGNTLNITWDYRKDMIAQENIEKMFSEYVSLIRLFANSDVDLIEKYREQTKIDTTLLFEKYNKVGESERLELPIALKEQFKKTVDRYADKTFITVENESYSYEWVYVKAKELADEITKKLKQSGKNKTRVAFIGHKNIRTFVKIVAAVLSNNSFCVINEDYGQDKKNETLQQLSNYVFVDEHEIIVSEQNSFINDDESYILFTSGTTGKPKGIIIDEKSALNTVLAINKMYNVTAADKVLNISNLYFDLSIYDIFSAMIVGSELISVDPMRWNQFEVDKANEITIWNSTPALAKEYALKTKLTNVRLFLMSGDFVPVGLVESLIEQYSDKIKVTSLGGATEASIWSNYYECKDVTGMNAIPYGYPLLAQEMYVVNGDTGLLCQKDVLGEICIAGEGLAEGYLDEEQTKNAFVPNEQLSKRIYKTGDLGYLSNSGVLYIVGRVAQEIKHNGYRIDLREIEKYINSVEKVSNAMVVIERQSESRTRLSAIIESNDRTIETKVRDYLSTTLPYYMIPSKMMVVKKLPLTGNGKVDVTEIRKWLSTQVDKVEKITEEQKVLLEVWKKTISDENYIPTDNQDATYFDVGGQSLQAVELMETIAQAYNIDISMQDIMSNLSLRSMMELIKRKKDETEIVSDSKANSSNDVGELVLLRKGSTEKNIVLIHGGTGEINLFFGFAKYFDEKYNIYGIRKKMDKNIITPSLFDFKLFAKAYNELLEGIESIDILAGWCIGGAIAYEMSILRPDKYNRLVFFNAESPMPGASVFPGFSVEQDIEILKQFSNLPFEAENFTSLEELWNTIIEVFKADNDLRLQFVNSLPKELTNILPDMDKLDAKTMVFLLNHWRGAYEARNHYLGNVKSSAEMLYINSIDEPMDNYMYWNNFVDMKEIIDAPGGHLSMFNDEHISIWCNVLNEKIEKWVH